MSSNNLEKELFKEGSKFLQEEYNKKYLSSDSEFKNIIKDYFIGIDLAKGNDRTSRQWIDTKTFNVVKVKD